MRSLFLATCEFSACTLYDTQTFLPLGFDTTRDQTILGIDGAVTSLRTLCIVLSALERKTPLGKSPIVVGLKMLCSLNHCEQSCGSDGREKYLCNGRVDLQTSDVEAVHAAPVLDAFVGAMIAGCLLPAPIMGVQFSSTMTADGESL
jgi:hypothetical protein